MLLFLLFDIIVICSTLLFLLFNVVHCCCSMFDVIAPHADIDVICSMLLLLLFDVVVPYSMLLLLYLFVFNTICLGTYLLCSRCCCSLLNIIALALFVSDWYFPPSIFCRCGRSCLNSSSSCKTWKAILFFSIFVC
jgi:hypothetical protein